jgi:pyrimidine operon attenuation protein/uracil phosphoribosyltransferase
MTNKVQLLDTNQIDTKIQRIAYEIVENNIDQKEIILAGIVENGLVIANILKQKIEKIASIKVKVVAIQIDKKNPIDSIIQTDVNMDKKSIIVVDDVANSGRTLLYALHPFLNVIAKKIQIAVLVDRKHKNYPITADYIGLQISTTMQEHIEVEVENGIIVCANLV